MEHGDEDWPLPKQFVWDGHDLYLLWGVGVPYSHHSSPDGGSVSVSACPPSTLVSHAKFLLTGPKIAMVIFTASRSGGI